MQYPRSTLKKGSKVKSNHTNTWGVKLTGYLDSPHMLSQYLLIYSEAIKATIKEIKAKTQNRLFYDPSLTHKGGLGGKTDIFQGIARVFDSMNRCVKL